MAVMDEEQPRRVQPCPECKANKHENCRGDSWDTVADAPAACPCALTGHGENP